MKKAKIYKLNILNYYYIASFYIFYIAGLKGSLFSIIIKIKKYICIIEIFCQNVEKLSDINITVFDKLSRLVIKSYNNKFHVLFFFLLLEQLTYYLIILISYFINKNLESLKNIW